MRRCALESDDLVRRELWSRASVIPGWIDQANVRRGGVAICRVRSDIRPVTAELGSRSLSECLRLILHELPGQTGLAAASLNPDGQVSVMVVSTTDHERLHENHCIS